MSSTSVDIHVLFLSWPLTHLLENWKYEQASFGPEGVQVCLEAPKRRQTH